MTPDTDGRATARGDPPDGPNVALFRPDDHAAAKVDRLVLPPRRSSRPEAAQGPLPTDPEPLTPDASRCAPTGWLSRWPN